MKFSSTFLKNPENFPQEPCGEPWGREQVILDLAGGPYCFSGLSQNQVAGVRQRFGDYLSSAPLSATAVEGTVFRAAADSFHAIDPRGWEYWLDLDHEPNNVRLAGRDLFGRLDWRPNLGATLWTPLQSADFVPAFENFLRLLVAYRLLETGGVLVHSAAVSDGTGAYLFPGVSGAGKSTVSRLGIKAGYTLLSDDLNALCALEEGCRVAHLPFTGDLEPQAPQHPFEPRAICRLVKGPSNRLQPMSFAQTLALIARCAPYVNNDPYRREQLLGNLERLLRTVSTHVLTFSLAGGFQRLLENSRRMRR